MEGKDSDETIQEVVVAADRETLIETKRMQPIRYAMQSPTQPATQPKRHDIISLLTDIFDTRRLHKHKWSSHLFEVNKQRMVGFRKDHDNS